MIPFSIVNCAAIQPTKECSQPELVQYGVRGILLVLLVRALQLSEKKKNKERKKTKHRESRGRSHM